MIEILNDLRRKKIFAVKMKAIAIMFLNIYIVFSNIVKIKPSGERLLPSWYNLDNEMMFETNIVLAKYNLPTYLDIYWIWNRKNFEL